MSRMFPFITRRGKRWCTWNPLRGKCPHKCIYCWSQGKNGLVQKYGMEKYLCMEFTLDPNIMKQKFLPGEFWFVQDMSDLFADKVPTRLILQVLDIIRKFPETKFLLLTKNPKRYLMFVKENEVPSNCVLGATVESDKTWFWDRSDSIFDKEYFGNISFAKNPIYRIRHMNNISKLTNLPLFVSVEPILNFSDYFVNHLKDINLWAVAVGYDNYGFNLPEPSLEETLKLIEELEEFTKVYRKSLRLAWWEKIEKV